MREVISIHIGQAGIQVGPGAALCALCTLLQAKRRTHSRPEKVRFPICHRALTLPCARRAGRQCLLGALLPGARCAQRPACSGQWPILLSGRCLPFNNTRKGPASSQGISDIAALEAISLWQLETVVKPGFLIIPL